MTDDVTLETGTQELQGRMADALAGTIDGSGMYVRGYAAGAEATTALASRVSRLRQENERLTEALKKIIAIANHDAYYAGEIARAALETK